ncbi:GNAT family N-acetyltransferase [Mariniflexile sp. HMF6888]|uniref:GNAT family N-acetyltransferase n=1 Tax=Mariniflexile sp. HMF6888 TaxID=3373086 RepID=UPI0037A03A05
MGFNVIHKGNFYTDLFEQRKVPSIYKCISNTYNTETTQKNNYNSYRISNKRIGSFQLVPNYLKTSIEAGYTLKRVFQKHGHAANLNNIDSVEDYLSKYCKANFRGNVRRPLKRLESCLNIHCDMFFGSITDEQYKHRMTCFHEMLSKRFNLLNVKNPTLDNWKHYNNIALEAIRKKEASLFVMYNNDEPIAFSLNFHFQDIFYFAIPTFNLDYSKFTLGNVVIYKNLEWCIQNNFKVFDMGYGSFENKVNWCNTTYRFEHHVIFKPYNILGHIHAFTIKNKHKLINYLLANKINETYRNVINLTTGNKKSVLLDYKILNNFSDYEDKELVKINFANEAFDSIKKPFFDFLYLNTENINDVSVYKVNKELCTYIIKGKKNTIKIEIT